MKQVHIRVEDEFCKFLSEMDQYGICIVLRGRSLFLRMFFTFSLHKYIRVRLLNALYFLWIRCK